MSFVLTGIVIYFGLVAILMGIMNIVGTLDRRENIGAFLLFTAGGIVYIFTIGWMVS